MGTNEHSVSKRTWPWRKDLPQVVQVALFAIGNENSASLRGWHEKVNQCWLANRPGLILLLMLQPSLLLFLTSLLTVAGCSSWMMRTAS